MSVVPSRRPELDHEMVKLTAYRLIMESTPKGIEILGDCPVLVLAMRGAGGENHYARYDDPIALITPAGVTVYNGNTDPGRTGLNKEAGKDYARLEPEVWPMIRGPHKGVPLRFRQPTSEQAREHGIVKYFPDDDPRAKGHFAVRRMHTPTEGKIDVGYFAINFHPGGMNGTGSAGCQTLPPAQYDEMRDLAYDAMDAAGQSWLPYVLTDKPLG